MYDCDKNVVTLRCRYVFTFYLSLFHLVTGACLASSLFGICYIKVLKYDNRDDNRKYIFAFSYLITNFSQICSIGWFSAVSNKERIEVITRINIRSRKSALEMSGKRKFLQITQLNGTQSASAHRKWALGPVFLAGCLLWTFQGKYI